MALIVGDKQPAGTQPIENRFDALALYVPVRLVKVFQAIDLVYETVILPHCKPPVSLSFGYP
jgi:hypothetical protein